MSFGGGESPTGTTFQTQFTRDAPQIEAAKMGLMGTAREYAQFGMNPWELTTPGATVGQPGFGKYEYKGPAGGAYAPGTKWEDLTRAQRAQEGQVDVPQQQVAGFDPQQQQAFQMAQQGIGAFQPYLNAAAQYAQQATQQYDPSTGYQQYMNPYQDEVIGAIEQQFQKAGNLQNLQATQAGAFGGARQGIQASELAGQRAQTVGQAQAQNYGQAQQQAQQQFQGLMGRYGEAAQQMAGLGGQQQQQQQADIASMMASGSVQQQAEQQRLDAQYRQGLQQMYEPYQRLGFVSDIYQGMPSSAMATAMGTSPGTSPIAQAVGTGIMGATALNAYQGYNQ